MFYEQYHQMIAVLENMIGNTGLESDFSDIQLAALEELKKEGYVEKQELDGVTWYRLITHE